MAKVYLLIFTLFICGCSSSPRYGSGKRVKKSKTRSSNYMKTQTGISSFYAEDFHGKLTANGEVYDMYGLSAALKALPLNTIVRVTNLENDKSLILRINDRGPYAKGRILDCSYGAALKLGFIGKGTAKVKIEVIEYGDDKYMKHKN